MRSILENLLLDTMFELPDVDGLEEVVLNRDTVEDNKDPVLVIADSKKKKSKKDKDKDKDKDKEKDKDKDKEAAKG